MDRVKLDAPPDVIWLQFHGDGDHESDAPVDSQDVTWSAEKVFEHDVNYVNAVALRRLANATRTIASALDEGLDTHRESNLRKKLRSVALELEKLAAYRPDRDQTSDIHVLSER